MMLRYNLSKIRMEVMLLIDLNGVQFIDTKKIQLGTIKDLIEKNSEVVDQIIEYDKIYDFNHTDHIIEVPCTMCLDGKMAVYGQITFVRCKKMYFIYDSYFNTSFLDEHFRYNDQIYTCDPDDIVITDRGIHVNKKKISMNICNLCEYIQTAVYLEGSVKFGIEDKNGRVYKTKRSGKTFGANTPTNDGVLRSKIHDYVRYGHWNELKMGLKKKTRTLMKYHDITVRFMSCATKKRKNFM